MPGEAPRRRRATALRALGIAALVLFVLLGAARLALDPLVASRTRNALNGSPDQRATFSGVSVSVLSLSYEIRDLAIEKRMPGLGWKPFFGARKAQAGLYWRELFHRHLVGGLRFDRPKLDLYSTSDSGKPKNAARAPDDLGAVLQHFVPFRLDRVEVRDGEVLWVDAGAPGQPRLWFHGIEGTLENFATRAALSRGEPTVLALSGTLQRSGKVSIYASADPLAKGLTFAGTARVQGLELPELGELLAAKADFTPDRGTLDVNARFKAVDGHLTGGVRPLLRNAGVRQAKPGLGAKIKAALSDAALKILSDRVPGRNAVATTIPLEGDLTKPDTKLWPTIMGVVRNAFVSGLADSVDNLPPKESKGRAG
ncbi:MAG: DUF748 domain-containing protein [Anaeromyxobacteraceae bacterium]